MNTYGRINYVRHLNGFFRQVKKDARLHANHISLYVALFQIWNQHRFINPFPIIRGNVLKLCRIGSYNTYTHCLKALHEFGYILYEPAGQRGFPSRISIQYLGGITRAPSSQLLLFDDPTEDESSRNIDTVNADDDDTSCANIATDGSRNIDSSPVAKMRPYNKRINDIKTESEDARTPIKKVKKKAKANTAVAPPQKAFSPPTAAAVDDFFHACSYPSREAQKFFHHYQANGWLQAGKTPIIDWQAAAHKWILNIKPEKSSPHGKRTTPATSTIERLHTNQDKSYTEPL